MYKAIQTVTLTLDGREINLVEGERAEVDEFQGAALVAGGYAELVGDEAPPADDDEELPPWLEKAPEA